MPIIKNFTIEGRKKQVKDIVRTWMYELSIPTIGDIVPGLNEEGLIIRTMTASIPGRTNEPIESSFMGLKQQFPGKETFTHTIDASFEESEDLYIAKGLYEWKEKIFQVNPDGIHAGVAGAPSKREGLVADIFLKLYRFNGDPLEKMYRLHNAWPIAMPEVPLDYAGSDSLKHSVTFEYDFWTLMNT